MKKLVIILIAVFCLSGCMVKGKWLEEGKTLKLEGWGAKQATWEIDGNKYSITKGEPFSMPDFVPLR